MDLTAPYTTIDSGPPSTTNQATATFDLQSGSVELAAGAFEQFTLQLNAAVSGNPSGVVSFGNSDTDEDPFDFLNRPIGSAGSIVLPLQSSAGGAPLQSSHQHESWQHHS